MENNQNNKSLLETKILPILNYIGIIGAIIMAIAYIIIVFVLINGFKAEALLQMLVKATVFPAVMYGCEKAEH